jgi:spermidine synthase
VYDVVTLEPMPPFFLGSNSLYSQEFYGSVEARLREGGCFAQWFPIHLLTPSQARAVASAFVKVFPQSILWFDPASADGAGHLQQGILLGWKAPSSMEQ